jgi:hypothetical protein
MATYVLILVIIFMIGLQILQYRRWKVSLAEIFGFTFLAAVLLAFGRILVVLTQ